MYERLPLEALVPNRQDPNKMSRMFAKKLRRNIRTHPNNAVGRVGSAEVSNARRDDEADRERSAVSKAIRRGGATRQAAPRRPNPSGRAWLHRISSSLVVDVSPWTRLPPRSSICSQALRDAASSIVGMGSEQLGRYETLTVRPHSLMKGKFELLKGHARLEALRCLGADFAIVTRSA